MALLKRNPLESMVDRLGNANPQLLRELRGRLKPVPVLGTFAVSIAGQGVYGLSRLATLPTPTMLSHAYCLGPVREYGNIGCVQSVGGVAINWPLWWADSLTHGSLWLGSIAIVMS